MNTTVLTEEVLSLASRLSAVQQKTNKIKNRINLLENKLTLAREANLGLANEEQDIVLRLQQLGYNYGNTHQLNGGTDSSHIVAWLNQLLQHHTPVSQESSRRESTNSESQGFGTILNKDSVLKPAESPLRATPRETNIVAPTSRETGSTRGFYSPTSAPSLSIRHTFGKR